MSKRDPLTKLIREIIESELKRLHKSAISSEQGLQFPDIKKLEAIVKIRKIEHSDSETFKIDVDKEEKKDIESLLKIAQTKIGESETE